MDWMQVIDYENNYLINVKGEVKGRKSGKTLKPSIARNGYKVVSLWSNNKGKTHYVHRLIASHFIKPYQGETVNHKDGNKLNNDISNLEWTSYAENNSHAYNTGLKAVSPELAKEHGKRLGKQNKNNSYRSIPIDVFDLDNNFIARYPSIVETAKQLGISRKPIFQGLRREVTPTKYKFEYAEEK